MTDSRPALHPGGEEHSRHMIELSGLPSGSRVLDMGAGSGETVRFLSSLGYDAQGIDFMPGSDAVQYGDLRRTSYPDGSFDGVISQCTFFVSGDIPAAFRESYRILKPGGVLMFSDVCFTDPLTPARDAGFSVEYTEDMTALWREYYIEAIWNGTASLCSARGKCRYMLLICRKE